MCLGLYLIHETNDISHLRHWNSYTKLNTISLLMFSSFLGSCWISYFDCSDDFRFVIYCSFVISYMYVQYIYHLFYSCFVTHQFVIVLLCWLNTFFTHTCHCKCYSLLHTPYSRTVRNMHYAYCMYALFVVRL